MKMKTLRKRAFKGMSCFIILYCFTKTKGMLKGKKLKKKDIKNTRSSPEFLKAKLYREKNHLQRLIRKRRFQFN